MLTNLTKGAPVYVLDLRGTPKYYMLARRGAQPYSRTGTPLARPRLIRWEPYRLTGQEQLHVFVLLHYFLK